MEHGADAGRQVPVPAGGGLPQPASERDELLAGAVAHCRAGRPAEAVAPLRRALALRPGDAEALNLLGVALDGAGDPAAGEHALAEALTIREGPSARSNHAMVLSHLGRHAEAEAEARRALELRPDYPEALNNLGVALDALRRPAEAEAAFRRAVDLRPGYPDGWMNLGNALKALGRAADAVEAYERALALNPAAAPPPALAPALREAGRPAEALAAFRAAAAARPDSPEALSDLAAALGEPSAESHAHRGQVLKELNRFEEAAAACERALALRPDHLPALTNLGNALRALGRLDEAERAERRACALKPGDVGLLNNLAITLQGQDRTDEALALLDLAGGLDPDDPETQHHRAMLLLRAGRLAEGWRAYEGRMRIRQAGDSYAQFAGGTRWAGEPLGGRTLLVVPEQGFGDTIQFARYVPLAAARGGRVVFGVQKPLARLMRSLAGGAAVVAVGEALPPHDLHVPLLSLPGLFGTELDTVPSAVPYLHPEPDALARWAGRIGDASGGLRVGLVWAGNPGHLGDRQRSLPFTALEPLWSVPGVRWFGLQVGARAADPAAADAPPCAMVDLSPELTDFAETAAAAANLDLVVSADTAVAHLAGALGRPVWVLLPRTPDWRWLRAGHANPWYPTLRLFRQGPDAAWLPVVAAVAEALRARAAPPPRAPARSSPSRDVLFGWGMAGEPGWGALGLRLLRGWAGRDDLRPYALVPPGPEAEAALDPLDHALVAPALARSASYARDLAGAAGRRASTSRLVLHALGDGLRRRTAAHGVDLWGAPTLAVAGFARTDPDPDALDDLRRYPLVVAPSRWAAGLLEGWGAGRVEVVEPGADDTPFHTGPRPAALADRFVVFSGGAVGHRRGHDLVLRAFGIFARRRPEALLLAAWPGVDADAPAMAAGAPGLVPPPTGRGIFDAAGWCEANGIARRQVLALGAPTDAALAGMLRGADVALFPDRAQGGPDPLALRSLACGVPTLLSANTGHLDLLARGAGVPLARQAPIRGAAHRGWGESHVDEIVDALERARRDTATPAARAAEAARFAAAQPPGAWCDRVAALLRPYLG